MERHSFECLPHSNTPIYFPSYLRQYNKQVSDYRNVNFTTSLPSYQQQFIDPMVFAEEEYDGPTQVFFSFGSKNCWLYEDEFCLLAEVLDRVEQMTIAYSHGLGVGPTQAIWDHSKSPEQLAEEGIEEFQHDLLSGYFRVSAVLRPL